MSPSPGQPPQPPPPATTPGSGFGETLRLVLTLTVAGLLSGLAIVGVYQATLPAIQANQAAALRRAVFQVLPGSERLQALVLEDGALVPRRPADGGERGSAEEGGTEREPIYGGYTAGGELVGYAVPAAGAGFQDTIRLLFGLDPAAERVVGMEILESRETPGLGDRIFKDQGFVAEFRSLAVEPPVELVKGHGPEPHQVDAITGATISSKAVVDIVNQGVAAWRPHLPEPAEAPPLLVEVDGEVPVEDPRGGPVPGGRQ